MDIIIFSIFSLATKCWKNTTGLAQSTVEHELVNTPIVTYSWNTHTHAHSHAHTHAHIYIIYI